VCALSSAARTARCHGHCSHLTRTSTQTGALRAGVTTALPRCLLKRGMLLDGCHGSIGDDSGMNSRIYDMRAPTTPAPASLAYQCLSHSPGAAPHAWFLYLICILSPARFLVAAGRLLWALAAARRASPAVTMTLQRRGQRACRARVSRWRRLVFACRRRKGLAPSRCETVFLPCSSPPPSTLPQRPLPSPLLPVLTRGLLLTRPS
jgi:hypothetical protein